MVSCVKAACMVSDITKNSSRKYRPPTNTLNVDKENECKDKKL
jgi:hypothetical protein